MNLLLTLVDMDVMHKHIAFLVFLNKPKVVNTRASYFVVSNFGAETICPNRFLVLFSVPARRC